MTGDSVTTAMVQELARLRAELAHANNGMQLLRAQVERFNVTDLQEWYGDAGRALLRFADHMGWGRDG